MKEKRFYVLHRLGLLDIYSVYKYSAFLLKMVFIEIELWLTC
jgi:hypothetical protein